MVSPGRWSVLQGALMVAVLALSGCVVNSDGSDADAELPDLAPPTLLADADVEEPDVAEDEPDGGMEPDGGAVIPDGGSMDADVVDMATPDMELPPDMMMALSIESCEDACNRYAECDRLGDRFGDYDTCINDCGRISRLGPPEEWWSCVELETCNLLRLCPVPPIEPLPCAEVCDLVGECDIEFPRGECIAACEESGEPFRTCGDVLYGGVCDNEAFQRCAVNATNPACGATCTQGVACNLVRERECLDTCFEPDPLAQRRLRRLTACATGAGDNCMALDLCFQDDGPAEAAQRCSFLCEGKEACGVGLGVDRLACVQACVAGENEPGGPDYEAELACAAAESCPALALCLDAAGAGIGPCFSWCQATTTCNPEADQDRTSCVEQCVEGFGDDDTLRFGAAAACLAEVGPGGTCEDLVACIPEGEPMVDCEGVCASLDLCQVPAEDCRANCEAMPDRELAICLADAQRTGQRCTGVAECAGWMPPASDPVCAEYCDVVSGCDGAVDPFLCRLECTPLPDEVPFQLACAELANCGAELNECRALEAVANPTCVELCTPTAAVTCGLFPDVETCQAVCTGRDASDRTPANYLDRVGECLGGAIDGEQCDAAAAANCFAPASCDLRDDLIFFNGNRGDVRIDTRGQPDQYPSPCGGSTGPEQIIVLNVVRAGNLRAEVTAADHDTVLYMRRPCDGDPNAVNVQCNDDGGQGLWSLINTQVQPGTYFLFAEGFGGRTGTMTVTITLP